MGSLPPAPRTPDTDVGGLTLSGGFGPASRKHHLAVYNLLSCRVVLAIGEAVRASSKANRD